MLRAEGPLGPDEVRGACAQAAGLLATGRVRRLRLEGCGADLGAVELVARLRLLTARSGVGLEVRPRDRAALAELLALLGLAEALEPLGLRALQPGGQPEAGEQGGIEEVVDVPDLPA